MTDVSIPKKHKAAVYDKPGSISTKIKQLDTPEPGHGEVLINLYVYPLLVWCRAIFESIDLNSCPHKTDMTCRTHSGVCHSDMGVMLNAWKTLPFPTQAGQVGGHEGVGKIVKMGPGTESSGVKLGQRVGIKWMAGICETCEACRAGIDASCFSGVSPPTPTYNVCYKLISNNCPKIRKSQATTPLVPSSNTSSAPLTTSPPFLTALTQLLPRPSSAQE